MMGPKKTLFSKRHERVLLVEKTLKVTLPSRLRMRLWQVLGDYNFAMQVMRDPSESWHTDTDVLTEVERSLLRAYGKQNLEAFDFKEDRRKRTDFKGFLLGAYPSQVLDAIELVYDELWDDYPSSFQQAVNQVMMEEKSGWLLCDGYFFQIDSSFLESHVISQTHELLKQSGFEGALEEFQQARNDLVSKDAKGAIQNACKAFESTLKAIEGRTDGNAKILIEGLPAVGFYKGLPDDFGPALGSAVLMSLPFVRNKLGGHGQGAAVVEVPESVATLAVNLSASLINFLVTRHLELNPRKAETPVEKVADDDLPF